MGGAGQPPPAGGALDVTPAGEGGCGHDWGGGGARRCARAPSARRTSKDMGIRARRSARIPRIGPPVPPWRRLGRPPLARAPCARGARRRPEEPARTLEFACLCQCLFPRSAPSEAAGGPPGVGGGRQAYPCRCPSVVATAGLASSFWAERTLGDACGVAASVPFCASMAQV
ncbi:unnamed protein product [Prorocentrum cordatum]|uniref:Uncharacterized protein n=2 Tax=Prorocentrum cordatum TaxID=2364126 RepID=A0ABN9UFZ7_9DINO|nr:unnamed protein product [Polarella glacialis]